MYVPLSDPASFGLPQRARSMYFTLYGMFLLYTVSLYCMQYVFYCVWYVFTVYGMYILLSLIRYVFTVCVGASCIYIYGMNANVNELQRNCNTLDRLFRLYGFPKAVFSPEGWPKNFAKWIWCP